MRVARVELRDFRNCERASVDLPDGLTVICGAERRGQDEPARGRLLRLHGRSPRTVQRARARFAAAQPWRASRSISTGPTVTARLEIGFEPGEAKRVVLDGADLEGPPGLEARPPVSVFLPERLELVKGAPGARRAHLDQLVAALWPSRAGTRSAYSRALAQRNALLGRLRTGGAPADALSRLGHGARAPGLPAHGGPARGDRRRRDPVSPPSPSGSGCPVRPRRATARAPRQARPSDARGGAGRAPRPPTWSAASPSTGRTATSSSCSWPARRSALVRLAGPAARGAPRAPVRRARAARRPPWARAADAARRRDVRARRRPARAARRAAARRRASRSSPPPSGATCPDAETSLEVEAGSVRGPSGVLAA